MLPQISRLRPDTDEFAQEMALGLPVRAESTERILQSDCTVDGERYMESCIEYRHFNERKYRGWHKKQNRYRN